MKNILLLISSLFLTLAWFTLDYNHPWVSFSAEFYAFLFLVPLLFYFKNKDINLPIRLIPLLLLSFIPVIQFIFNKILFFSTSLLSFIYILSFFISIILGHNLYGNSNKLQENFSLISRFLALAGIVTSIIAILQFFNLESFFPFIKDMGRYQRPFANFAQPNNMATFLIICLMSCLYLYQKNKNNTIIYFSVSLIICIGIVLSQSRTAFLSVIFIVAYLFYCNKYNFYRINFYFLFFYFLFFIFLFLFLPELSQYIFKILDINSVELVNIVRKTQNDSSRFEIWQQMILAISKEPIWGYGWYQTEVASLMSLSEGLTNYWVNSAHNFVLDFIIWNGFLIGIPFLLYLVIFGYIFIREIKDLEGKIVFSMLIPFLNHSMLEFPQNYSYFLLPIGFLIGLVLNKEIKVLKIPKIVSKLIFFITLLLIFFVYREYNFLRLEFLQARYEQDKIQTIKSANNIILLNALNARINFYRVDPYRNYTNKEILELEKTIMIYPSPYNLIKFSKLLYHNHHIEMVHEQLRRLRVLWQIDMNLEDLEKK